MDQKKIFPVTNQKLIGCILCLLLSLLTQNGLSQSISPPVSNTDSTEFERSLQIESYTHRLQLLREKLAHSVEEYVGVLTEKTTVPTSIDQVRYIDRNLKPDLAPPSKQIGDLNPETKNAPKTSTNIIQDQRKVIKNEVINSVNEATSGEAVVAINRAKIELFLEEINTIEKYFGELEGKFSTELNIFNLEELKSLSEKIKTQLRALNDATSGLPLSEVSTDLLMRRSELQHFFDEVESEIKRRNSGLNEPKLKRIAKDLTVKQLRNSEQFLNKFESRESLLSNKIRHQVELRLHHSPGDASLINLKNGIIDIIEAEKYALRSFAKESPPSNWTNPLEEVVKEIRKTLYLEQIGVELRNPIIEAEARSQRTIYQKWIKLAYPNLQVELPLDALSYQELKDFQLRARRWLVLLEKEQSKSEKSSVAIEITEAKKRLILIDNSLQRRSNQFPPKSPILEQPLNRGPPLEAFESKLTFYEKYFRAVELRLYLDKPINILDHRARAVYNENISSLRSIEKDLLTYARGKKGNQIINEFIDIQRSIVQYQPEITKQITQQENVNNIRSVINDTKAEMVSLKRKVNTLRYSNRVIYQQNAKSPSINSTPFLKSRSLKNISTKSTYPINYNSQKGFPKNEAWTKSYEGLIKDKERAPRGVIIDGQIQQTFAQKIQEVKFDVFSNEIFIKYQDRWGKFELLIDPILLRQAWAFVQDQRVASVDLRGFSEDELSWFFKSYLNSGKSTDQIESFIKAIPRITTVNIHPAFQDTYIGEFLILADQVVFDLLPVQLFRIEGWDNRFKEVGINTEELKDEYKKDFAAMILQPNHPRSISISILSVTSSTAHILANGNIRIKPKINFAIYRIPNQKSDASYTPLSHSSNWFNKNQHQLMQKIDSLKKLRNMGALVTFLRTVEQQGIPHNFNDLVYLQVNKQKTPKYLFLGNSNKEFESIIQFLEGR